MEQAKIQSGWEGFDLGVKLGFTMIPGVLRTKTALVKWKQYQLNKPLDEEIKLWKWEYKSINPLMLTGAPSGIIVLDQDGVTGLETLSRYGELPETVIVTSPRGQAHQHYWFRYDKGLGRVRNFTGGYRKGELPGLDLKGDGGLVVFPGATHKNGGIYRFKEGCSTGEVEVAELPGWLYRYIASRNKYRELEPEPSGVQAIDQTALPLPTPYGDGKVGNRKSTDTGERLRLYAQAALRNQASKVACSAPGERNDTLFKAAASIATFITNGLLTQGTVESELEAAAATCGLSRDDGLTSVRATIRSGLETGRDNPLPILDDLHQDQHQKTPFDHLKGSSLKVNKKNAWRNGLVRHIYEQKEVKMANKER
jgi:hypothetical protein